MNAHCLADFADGFDRWHVSPRAARSKDSGWLFTRLDSADVRRAFVAPGQTYSKRSAKLHQLRLDAAELGRADFEDTVAATQVALTAAETFINSLWEGCLDFELEMSHDGEINFIYGDANEFFHIHLDEEGSLSYYAVVGGQEQMGSRLDPASFPQKDLLSFIDRRK